MKKEILSLLFLSLTICTQFNLRRLEASDIDGETEESCKAIGKKYQTTNKIQCSTGEADFYVEKEADCKKGVWTNVTTCNVPELTEVQCTGTPTWYEATAAYTPYCELEGTKLDGLTTLETCQIQLVWIADKCSNPDKKNRGDCESAKEKWVESETQGSCSISGKTTKTDCEAAYETWTPAATVSDEDKDGTCSKSGITSKNQCNTTPGVWTSSSSVCTDGETTKEEDCVAKSAKWSPAHCSISTVEQNECNGRTPTFHDGQATEAVCKLGEIVLTSRKTSTDCKKKIETIISGNCTNKEVTNEKDCTSDAEAEKVPYGECVDNSNSKFLKGMSLALLSTLLMI